MTLTLLALAYLGFIGLGMQMSLFGSAWPSIRLALDVPVSWASAVSMITSLGMLTANLNSERLSKRFSSHTIITASILLSVFGLFGFSLSRSFWVLCLMAIPVGLGTGSLDNSINSFVALHYKGFFMMWMHCVWGIGAGLGPNMLRYAIASGRGWGAGYRYVVLCQTVLFIVFIFSTPLWKRAFAGQQFTDAPGQAEDGAGDSDRDVMAGADEMNKVSERDARKPYKLSEIIVLPGAKAMLFAFFTYCTIEQTTSLWASSYLAIAKGFTPDRAAQYGSLLFIGMTVGRVISGFLNIKLNDLQVVFLGACSIFMGIAVLLLPSAESIMFLGLLLIGIGCAPIYPCLLHVSPYFFGADKAQAFIGAEAASSSLGSICMTPAFGLIANRISVGLFPHFLFAMWVCMFLMCLQLAKLPMREKL